MDNHNDIRRLVELFYDGSTTPDDEMRLLGFFRNAGELPPDLERERRFFAALDGQMQVPDGLEERIAGAIDRAARRSLRLRFARIASVAAAVAILLTGAGALLTHHPSPAMPADDMALTPAVNNPYEVTDPEEACRLLLEIQNTVDKAYSLTAQSMERTDRSLAKTRKTVIQILQ